MGAQYWRPAHQAEKLLGDRAPRTQSVFTITPEECVHWAGLIIGLVVLEVLCRDQSVGWE